MKPSEFYEKYWKFQDKDGNMVSPPPLTDQEKKFMDENIKPSKQLENQTNNQ